MRAYLSLTDDEKMSSRMTRSSTTDDGDKRIDLWQYLRFVDSSKFISLTDDEKMSSRMTMSSTTDDGDKRIDLWQYLRFLD
ncbi:MAG TPA: hypothetical protein ENF37_06480 [Beggiatoa sp.]|nr:hypothetical protein [Beggiatoa sp.]